MLSGSGVSLSSDIVYKGEIGSAPNATLHNDKISLFTNVGDDGAYYKSNDTIWKPLNGVAACLPRINYHVFDSGNT